MKGIAVLSLSSLFLSISSVSYGAGGAPPDCQVDGSPGQAPTEFQAQVKIKPTTYNAGSPYVKVKDQTGGGAESASGMGDPGKYCWERAINGEEKVAFNAVPDKGSQSASFFKGCGRIPAAEQKLGASKAVPVVYADHYAGAADAAKHGVQSSDGQEKSDFSSCEKNDLGLGGDVDIFLIKGGDLQRGEAIPRS